VKGLRRGAAVAAFVGWMGMGGAPALAHPPPLGTGLWWVPAPPDATGSARERLVIRTPRGFVLESPATNEFRFLCNEALGVQDGEDAAFAAFAASNAGVLLITTFAKGVLRGSADGCHWAQIAEATTKPAFDVVVTASAAEARAYVVGGIPHEGEHFWVGQGGGTTWTALANSDVPYTRIRVAAGNPRRFYLTGIGVSETGTAVHRLGVSDDGGSTVVDRIIALGPDDLQARVLDVDPSRPDHVYVHAESNSAEIAERLLGSEDGGVSFATLATLHDIKGFTQSDDGSRAWVGGKEGIYRSVDGGASFAPLAAGAIQGVTCLAYHHDILYACGVLQNRMVVAASQDGGDGFEELFSFDRVKEALGCPELPPADSPAVVCASSLNHWRYELGTLDPTGSSGGAGGSGGGAGGAAGAGGRVPSPPSGSSGCAVGGRNRDHSGALHLVSIAAAIAIAFVRLRTRSDPPTP
jgi:hypothetical protein